MSSITINEASSDPSTPSSGKAALYITTSGQVKIRRADGTVIDIGPVEALSSIDLIEQASVATPASGHGTLYLDSGDNLLKTKLSDGSVVIINGLQSLAGNEVDLTKQASVSTPASGHAALYVDSGDNKVKTKLSDGTVITVNGISALAGDWVDFNAQGSTPAAPGTGIKRFYIDSNSTLVAESEDGSLQYALMHPGLGPIYFRASDYGLSFGLTGHMMWVSADGYLKLENRGVIIDDANVGFINAANSSLIALNALYGVL